MRLRLEMGRYVLAEDYVRALDGREMLRREVDSALAQHDALALPALPIPAPPIGAASVQVGASTEPVRNLMLAADAAVQCDGPSRNRDAVRTHLGGTAVFGSARRRRTPTTLLPVALACEAQISGVLRPRSGALGG